jgi:hypothetical protein
MTHFFTFKLDFNVMVPSGWNFFTFEFDALQFYSAKFFFYDYFQIVQFVLQNV